MSDTLSRMTSLAIGHWLSRAIYVGAELKIADLVKDEPKAIDELAKLTDTEPSNLYRLLSALASFDIFTEISPKRFAITPLAQHLRSDAQNPLRDFILYFGAEPMWRSMGHLLHSVKTGESAMQSLFGENLYSYWNSHPEFDKLLANAMARGNDMLLPSILSAYNFSTFEKLVDIGGAQGCLIAAILKAHPTVKGILYDRPNMLPFAEGYLKSQGVFDRCELVSGNFFESVPPGGDGYLIKGIFQDHSDEAILKLLVNIYNALSGENSRLLAFVAASEVATPGDGDVNKLNDLHTMVVHGGRVRTIQELKELFQKAGLKLVRMHPTPGGATSILEYAKGSLQNNRKHL